MKFAELPDDKMYCVEQKRDFFFAVLREFPEIYIAIPTGIVNKDEEEVFECGEK